jgi:cytoskeleton protein RodZ
VREHRKLTVEDVSRSTRISGRYLAAIEADDYERLPSATFVRGYIKQLAEVLEVSDRGVVDGFMDRFRQHRG